MKRVSRKKEKYDKNDDDDQNPDWTNVSKRSQFYGTTQKTLLQNNPYASRTRRECLSRLCPD